MKKLSLILPLILALFLTGCGSGKSDKDASSGAKGVLKVGITGMSYPNSFHEGSKIVGFDYDVIGEAAKRAGYGVEYQTMDFPGLLGAVNSGKIDTAASNVTWTEERDKSYIFTIPYAYDGVGLAAAKDNDSLTNIDQLAGKTIATGAGSTNEVAVKRWVEKTGNGAKIRSFDSAQAAAQEVTLGRADAVARPHGATVAQIKFQGLGLKTLDGDLLSYEQTRFPFANTETGKKQANEISDALREMSEDGTLKQLSEKYFSYDRTQYSEKFNTPDATKITTPDGS